MAEMVTSDPRVMGGRLCLAGTRVTVRAVEALIEEGLDNDGVAAELPVTTEQVEWVRRHMGEVRGASRP